MSIEQVRRDDGETVGRVRALGPGRWVPETVFGGALGGAAARQDAEAVCREQGMAALAEPWWRDTPTGPERVWLLEVHPDRLVVTAIDPRYRAVPEVLDPVVAGLRRTP